jgi:signal transduction histidine kinase
MDGTPVRGQQKIPIVRLNRARSVESFHAEIIGLLTAEFQRAEILFGSVDTGAGIPQLPSWIKAHLDRQPGLRKKLEQGEMVGIGASDENPQPRPTASARSSLVLIPVISDGRVHAAIALVSSLDGPQLSAEDIEAARQFAGDAAPILARIQEVETLRRENEELQAKTTLVNAVEEEMAGLLEENNMLHALLQMRSFQQIHVAHELRTPLAAIRGYTRMIVDGRGGEVNDTQKEYLRIVSDNTNRLISLVAWMSYIADVSAQHLKLSTFDFREVWSECGIRNQHRLAEKSLMLVEHVPNEPFVIIGDREKLTYALDELLTLGVRLSETGGTITVDLSRGREMEINFKLAEKGGTITADALGKIFDRPVNTIAKPAAQDDSSAINLSGVYDVVGMHGGRLFVNTSAGQGATFLFTLPAITTGEESSHYDQTIHSGRRRR